MRYLHAVALHEKFVASGEYRYFRDGEALAIREKWTIHELMGGAIFYRVDEDGRDEDGLSILSEAFLNPEGQIERYNVQSFNPKDSETKLFKADYSFNEGYVQIGRKVQGQDREYEEFPLLVKCATYIKQTVFMGLTIRDVLANGGQAEVFAPQLLSMSKNVVQKIIVKARGDESIAVGRKHIDAKKYQISDDVFYWLDEHLIPIKRSYSHNGFQYMVQLTNYAHR
ncbi:MAG: hypothetical protein Q9P01_16105 [Anaerolineae bacterium]|nr:hypothetical protein [Anaerolineae bacterium]MDQ7036292.1 hypothetical protein [Anaerolineae bacterium]